jgi:hypothetical protein
MVKRERTHKYTTQKTKDQATRIAQTIGGEHMCAGRVGTSSTPRVTLVTNPVISHE